MPTTPSYHVHKTRSILTAARQLQAPVMSKVVDTLLAARKQIKDQAAAGGGEGVQPEPMTQTRRVSMMTQQKHPVVAKTHVSVSCVGQGQGQGQRQGDGAGDDDDVTCRVMTPQRIMDVMTMMYLSAM